MAYEIIMAPEAAEDHKRLPARDRAKVREALEVHLRHEPTKVSKSRIKRLRGLRRPQYRLRVDDLRIFYDVTDQEVQILAMVAKADVDAWLAECGEHDEDDPAVGSKE